MVAWWSFWDGRVGRDIYKCFERLENVVIVGYYSVSPHPEFCLENPCESSCTSQLFSAKGWSPLQEFMVSPSPKKYQKIAYLPKKLAKIPRIRSEPFSTNPKCIAKTKSPQRSLPFLGCSMAMITSNACRSACELRSWSTKMGVNAPDVSSNVSIRFPTTCLFASLRQPQKQFQTRKNDERLQKEKQLKRPQPTTRFLQKGSYHLSTQATTKKRQETNGALWSCLRCRFWAMTPNTGASNLWASQDPSIRADLSDLSDPSGRCICLRASWRKFSNQRLDGDIFNLCMALVKAVERFHQNQKLIMKK